MSDASISIALERFTTFGDLLKYLRRRTGMTQRELSIAVGYSDAQICRLEQNERLPDIATLTARFLPVLMLEDCPEAAERLLDLAANVRKEDAPASGSPPYRGLYFFDEADAELFFGREDLVASVVDRIRDGLNADQRFLAIIGASGSGKSSLVRAGVIPALGWSREFAGWSNFVLTPTSHPLNALGEALSATPASDFSADQFAALFAKNPRGLDQSLEQIAEASNAKHSLLVIDQFEELFTLCHNKEEQAAFVDNILAAANQPGGKTSVLFAMRADFYAHCARYEALRQALAQNQEYIGPMGTEELRQVIEKPAEHGRWEIESGLVDLMLHDIGADKGRIPEPGALPLLSHALLETWQRRRGRMLTLSGYTASGGIRGAIAETAEAVFQDQLEPDQRNIAQQIFLRLTEIGGEDTTTFTRRRVGIDELVSKPDENRVIEQVLLLLANARLITTEQDTVEVAHEALIREWPTLLNWLEEDQENLRLHRRLTEAAQEWDITDRDPSRLYRGARLAQALEWAQLHTDAANLLEKEFLDASQQMAEKEIKEREEQQQRELEAAQKIAAEQARAARFQKSRSWWLAGASLIAIVLTILALISRSSALRTAEINHSLVLANLAVEANEAGDVDQALALALEAVNMDDPPPEAVSKLAAVASGMGTRAVLIGHHGAVYAGDFSPDETQAVTVGCAIETDATCHAGEFILWDLTTMTETARWSGHESRVTALAGRPGSDEALSGDEKGRLILWNIPTQEQLALWETDGGTIHDIAIAPDGETAVAACDNGVLIVLDLKQRQINQRLQKHDEAALVVDFSPDGTQVLSGSADTTMILWDVATGEPLQTFVGSESAVVGIAFLPDGETVLSGNRLALRLWDIASGKELQLRESGDTISHLALSPNGSTVLRTVDHVIYAWDVNEWFAPHRKIAGMLGVNHEMLVISDNGHFALTGDSDGGVRIWNLSGANDLQQTDIGFSATSLAVSPDGQRLAIGGWGYDGVVWDITKSEPILELSGGLPLVAPGAIAFSPDGNWIAAGSGLYDTGENEGGLLIWDADTGDEVCILQDGPPLLRSVAFSPDSQYLLSGSQGEGSADELLLWSVEDCNLVRRFQTENDTTGIDFSGDGRYALTSSAFSGKVTIWDVATGEPVQVWTLRDEVFLDTAFGPNDETALAGTLGGSIIQWDVANGSEVSRLTGHNGGVWSLALSPDGHYLASSDDTGTVILWDITTNTELRRHNAHSELSFDVAFAPDGQTLYSVSVDETLVAWQLGDPSLPALRAWIEENRYVRALTCEERARFNITPLCDTQE